MLPAMKTQNTDQIKSNSDVSAEADDDRVIFDGTCADDAKWILLFVGHRRIIWPAHAISEFNDWEAAY